MIYNFKANNKKEMDVFLKLFKDSKLNKKIINKASKKYLEEYPDEISKEDLEKIGTLYFKLLDNYYGEEYKWYYNNLYDERYLLFKKANLVREALNNDIKINLDVPREEFKWGELANYSLENFSIERINQMYEKQLHIFKAFKVVSKYNTFINELIDEFVLEQTKEETKNRSR